jgi:hypothetical protein
VLLHVERGSADRPAGRRLSDDDLGAHFLLMTSTSLDRCLHPTLFSIL